MFLHDLLTFSKAERRAIFVLLAVILVLAIALSIWPRKSSSLSTLTPSSPADSGVSGNTEKAVPFAFDPNTADSATLRALGLTPFVASNIVKYRRAGGRFRTPDALARIYGMDSATFTRIRPYIDIASPAPTAPSVSSAHPVSPAHPVNPANPAPSTDLAVPPPPREPSPYKAYMENKLPDGTFLDLNKADSADLVRIPGIGPYYASRIVRLRRQLGGFVAVAQLNDIPNLPDIGDWVTIEPGTQQRINVNTATLTTLKNHPYIGYYRARAIMNLRHRDGRILSLRQLSFLDEFSDADIQRLAPYLSFE